MIITLKGADFSASNIGTLSTWRISHSLGAGATYEGATSVDKGAAFSATITLAEGYEIGAAGVTITMGGIVLSGAHSISGNVITVTIASVIGNVLIKVPTVNTAGGDEPEEPEEPDTPDVPGTNEPISITWEQGAISNINGNLSSDTRIRTTHINVTNLTSLTTNFDTSAYAIAIYWYDSSNDTKSKNSPSWGSRNLNITASNKEANFVRIVAKKLDESNFTPDQSDVIGLSVIV